MAIYRDGALHPVSPAPIKGHLDLQSRFKTKFSLTIITCAASHGEKDLNVASRDRGKWMQWKNEMALVLAFTLGHS